MPRKRKLGIAAGAICLLLCTFGAFTCAEPQLPLANCTTKLNEQPTNHNPAYTDQVVEEQPITIDLEHDFEEEEWVENILRELPVNSLPILIIIIDTDFTDLHRRYCPDY